MEMPLVWRECFEKKDEFNFDYWVRLINLWNRHGELYLDVTEEMSDDEDDKEDDEEEDDEVDDKVEEEDDETENIDDEENHNDEKLEGKSSIKVTHPQKRLVTLEIQDSSGDETLSLIRISAKLSL